MSVDYDSPDFHSPAESNARAAARGRYYKWLVRRFANVHLLEMVDDMDPISLRKIFVPLQVGVNALNEDKMESPAKLEDEKLPGMALWDLLVENPFVLLSGLPGSGKTTLVHALIMELCGEHVSELRKRLVKFPGLAPIPLILRNYQLGDIRSLDELLDAWWRDAETNAKADGLTLDVERLRATFDPRGENFPVFLLFDGIDETGGKKIREQLLLLTKEARQRGWRVLVTGRPSGYEGVERALNLSPGEDLNVTLTEKITLHHVLPFAWPQIQGFIRDWYGLRKEWQRGQKDGMQRFLDALQDKNRQYLLTLARRPIFLTLMAHVHCTDNQMPEGRAELYRRIVDLYLIRQEKHRQLRETLHSAPMPHWPDAEKRLALGYLAWQSQVIAAQKDKDDPESRRVVWERATMENAITEQLGTKEHGRFTVLRPEDAPDLLKYFLHPAGLLVEPEDNRIQFAHLSFQEYLCADFLYSRAKVKGLRDYLEQELFPNLGKPGWLEVGLLLLTIHAKQTTNEGHFEMLSWLAPAECFQARLLVMAFTGGELPFTDGERIGMLPLAMACALLHPKDKLGRSLATLPAGVRRYGLDLIVKLFLAANEEAQWDELCKNSKELQGKEVARSNWLTPSINSSWDVDFSLEEARAHSLLLLVHDSDWDAENGGKEGVLAPEGPTAQAVADWLIEMKKRHGTVVTTQNILWQPGLQKNDLPPSPTYACLLLNALLPPSGPLWKTMLQLIPLNFWLLQGPSTNDDSYSLELSLPHVLLSLYPTQEQAARPICSLGLYQIIQLIECIACYVPAFFYKRAWSLTFSRSWSLALSRSLSRSISLSRALSQRLLARALALSLSRSRLLSLPWPLIMNTPSKSFVLTLPPSPLLTLSRSFELSLRWSLSLQEKINKIGNEQASLKKNDSLNSPLFTALEQFLYRYAAFDWFREQADEPSLMERRGLRPGEPLPRELGLFDGQGYPLPVQQRENWVRLRAWLDDDEKVLSFFFPDGLADEDRQVLLADLAILRKQPWSPQAGLDALLAGWPETEPERPFTMEHAEAELEKACDKFLADLSASNEEKGAFTA